MRLKKGLSFLLAVVLLFSATQTGMAKAAAMDGQDDAGEVLTDIIKSVDDAEIDDDAENIDSMKIVHDAEGDSDEKDDGDEKDAGDGEGAGGSGASSRGVEQILISNLRTSYEASKDTVTLRYELASEFAYVKIYVNGAVIKEKYTDTVYDFDQGEDYEFEEGKTYDFKIEAYNEADIKCGSVTASTTIPYKQASVDSVDVDYDLEQLVLTVEWSGENIDYAEIYQDNVRIAMNQTTGSFILPGWRLDASSKHTYKVVPYNKKHEVGKDASYLLEVDDYVARIANYEVTYNPDTKQLQANWAGLNSNLFAVYLNDVLLVDEYKKNTFTANFVLQPGAAYTVSIMPYNFRGEEGEAAEEDITYGDFEVPDQPSVSVTSVPVKDSAGKYTGFAKPAVQVKWDAQEWGVYEIYRAEKNTQSAYSWIATITASKDGEYSYIDEKAGLGRHYYKIRRKIVEDDYLDQEILTSLSEEGSANVSVPKASVKAKLNEKGQILLTMQSSREYVTGYEIYRKCGKQSYKMIAAITQEQYIDEDVAFGKTYSYKVKAFYYEANNGKTYGSYSNVSKVKNALGSLEADVTAKSADTVSLTWSAAANAQGYEVYHKSGTQGDSYTLLTTTKKLSLEHKTGKSGTHYFMIKAFQTTKNGKSYFSTVEVSIKMGFSAPKGFQVRDTSYTLDKTTNVLTQKDTLTWNRVYGAKGYYLEVYNTVTKKYTRVAKIKGGNKTSYTLTNLVTAEAKTLKYRLSAYQGSTVKVGETLDITLQLGTVTGVKAAKSGSNVKVSWKSVTGAELYQVYRSNGRTMILVGQTNKTSLMDQGLGIGVPYCYYVQAVSNTLKLTGAKSAPVAYINRPAKVSDLTAKKASGGSVQLAWKAASNANGYVIYYKSSAKEKYQKLAEVSAKTTTYIHEGLDVKSGTTCYYKVTAVQTNLGNVPAESKAVSVKVKYPAAS